MEAIAGMRVLVAGGDAAEVEDLRARLVALDAIAGAAPGDPDALARAVASDPPTAVLALAGLERTLRERLDPLRLDDGPPVVALGDVVAPGEPFGETAARRLRAIVDRRGLRARQAELQAALAEHALTARRDLEAARLDALRRLALAAEFRDDNTREHTERVADLAALLARGLGLDDRTVWLVRQTASLHDVGKIGIPDSILLKPGRLTPEEFEVVKSHAVLGARVLAGGETDLLRTAEEIARSHHERWDGTGYPDGLAGTAIPVAARLVHVADVFDVLLHERPYRESWTVEAATEEIRRGAGTQFDPDVVAAFEAIPR
jgi:HD-GYP domain-containing protein (c-di-GMP phosphodiesterase class II)